MEESQEFEPLQLRPIQYIPPAPNHIASAIDWIPEFAGHAWVAYGAGPTVVITTTPVPAAEEEESRTICPFFQQVLQPFKNNKGDEDNDDIRAVAWTPVVPSNGILAIGAGESVYIYEPSSLVPGTANANSIPEMPLAWRQVRALTHTSRVHAVVWTESGDGLLTTGSEVIMWTKCDNVWNPLWKSKQEQPHSLVSTTWSAKGLAATAADGSTCARGLLSMTSSSVIGSSKGKVTVSHWDDMSSLQEIELSHPQPVSMIQWRSSNFSTRKANDELEWKPLTH